MKRQIVFLLAVCLLAGETSLGADPALDNEDKKTLYALGLAMSQRLQAFEFSAEEIAVVSDGLGDGLSGAEPRVPLQTYGPKIDSYLQARLTAAAEKEKRFGQDFLEQMAQNSGAVKSESGLVYIEQQAGEGPSPDETSRVKVHYEGRLRDGTLFDSSRQAGQPATFSLDGVVPCFSEGIRKMRVGGKSKLVCPSDLAYGDRGFPPRIPPGATLVFEVELLELVDKPAAPSTTEPAP